MPPLYPSESDIWITPSVVSNRVRLPAVFTRRAFTTQGPQQATQGAAADASSSTSSSWKERIEQMRGRVKSCTTSCLFDRALLHLTTALGFPQTALSLLVSLPLVLS